ncbi:hypothetical protein DPMN_085275 [Dreissena polymorpha]|uniref:Uncharacterized protein n=1 Tax=Dreissena polymorpha TaxID=45954 RepID=A0A9D4BJ99_DREPO|nr:hypothetical protein DPMN_085275 [Dreissena polymorpha]
MITTEISNDWKPESKRIKSSKLRIAYKHFGRGSGEYKEQIEKLKTHCVTSSDDYSLKMPEDIKEDLRMEDE